MLRMRRTAGADASHLRRCAALVVLGYDFVPRALHLHHPAPGFLGQAGERDCKMLYGRNKKRILWGNKDNGR